MSDSLFDLAPHLCDRLASALESGLLSTPYAPASLRSVIGNTERTDSGAQALADLEPLGLSGKAAAMWRRSVGQPASRRQGPDHVWSGTEVAGLHARDTRRVY